MSLWHSTSAALAPDSLPLLYGVFWRWGRALLAAGLLLSLAFVLYLAWSAPEVLPFVPLAILGAAAIWALFRRPLLNLCAVLAGFVVIIDFEAGIQATEIIYGLYYLAFLAWWFVTRFFVYSEPVLRTSEDKALFAFLVAITLSIGLTMLFGGTMRGVLSEWTALMMLGFYFPVKEACARYRYGVWCIMLVLAWLGVFIAVRNLIYYQELLIATSDIYEAAGRRMMINDGVLMGVSLFAFAALVFAEGWRTRAVLSALFLLFFVGLILTQSRTYWLALVLGVALLFVFVGGRQRRRIVVAGAAGFLSVIAVGFAFFGDFMLIVLDYFARRFASIGTAATEDVSLVNRFREAEAAWGYIQQNPVLGYGMGVPYRFHDVVHNGIDQDSFVHNQYLMLWFKFGIWGLGLVLFFWARAAWRGVQAFRLAALPLHARIASLGAAACLMAYFLSALASPPLYLSDTILLFGIFTGLTAGVWHRHEISLDLLTNAQRDGNRYPPGDPAMDS